MITTTLRAITLSKLSIFFAKPKAADSQGLMSELKRSNNAITLKIIKVMMFFFVKETFSNEGEKSILKSGRKITQSENNMEGNNNSITGKP